MNSFGNQSRICSKQIFWWQKRIWNPSSSNLHPKHQSSKPKVQKEYQDIGSSRTQSRETRRQFLSYFSAILFHFYRCYDDIYGKNMASRDVKEQQKQRTPVATTTSRRKDTPPLSSRLAEVVPCHKNAYRAQKTSCKKTLSN